MRRFLFLLVAVLLLSLPVRATADQPLEFGVYGGRDFTFGGYVGQPGTHPAEPDLTMNRIVELAGGHPFQYHTYAQWNDGIPAWLESQIDTAAADGLEVNLALKYVPPSGHEGDVAGFAAWVKSVVASHPQVTAWQITNEADFPGSPDTDGSHVDAAGALIAGVEAAASVKQPGQKIGFNWLYDLDPAADAAFWSQLRVRGGPAFRAALDFAGVDIYAGTYFPPLYSADDYRDFRDALVYVRRTMMPLAGLGRNVPIYIQETSYPTLAPLRTEAHQARALSAYIRTTQGLNVGLLQWFELTDAQSTLGDGWGLLRPDFSRKPVFCVLKRAVQGPAAPCES